VRIHTDRRRKLPFAAHGSSGKSAHWLTTRCPIERRGGYRCVEDGLTHDSEVRTEQRLLARLDGSERIPLSADEAAAVVDAVISLGVLEPVVLEHAGAYASGPSKADELPSIRIRKRSAHGYVVRLRGCTRYRRHVLELVTLIPGITLVRP
jgi:hypothetical protein